MQTLSQTNLKKALRKLSTPWTSMDQVEATLSALQDESDRGVMLLVATQLEDALTHYVSVRLDGLTIAEREGFLGPDGPAGAFGVKIKLAAGMKIIHRRAYDALEVVRHIRNASAHALHPITFDTPIVKQAVLALLPPDERDKVKDQNAEFVRLIFRMACLEILNSFARLDGPGGGLQLLTRDPDELDPEY